VGPLHQLFIRVTGHAVRQPIFIPCTAAFIKFEFYYCPLAMTEATPAAAAEARGLRIKSIQQYHHPHPKSVPSVLVMKQHYHTQQ
jgi:hypothetical protein